jgi:hypothetical protein
VHMFDGDEAAFRRPGEVHGTACPTSQQPEELQIGPARRRAPRSRCEHSIQSGAQRRLRPVCGPNYPGEKGSR